MKLFSTSQIADIDQYTIINEPIKDIDLMERASLQIKNWLAKHISKKKHLVFFAGPGNNGGDALAVARMCAEEGFKCTVYRMDLGRPLKGSPAINWERLGGQSKVGLNVLIENSKLPAFENDDIILDGLFGSGLTRPLDGFSTKLVRWINESGKRIIAIDVPSGLLGENNSGIDPKNVIHADVTLTLQFPKLSFFFAENEYAVGKWVVLPIGLHPEGIEKTQSSYFLLDNQLIRSFLYKRNKFSHKGNYGHALLIAGSYGKMGAAVLASKACLRAGVGLLTSHIPRLGYEIIQGTVPEAMTSIDPSDLMFTEFPDIKQFSAIGIGPGLDKKQNSKKALKELLMQKPPKLVLDADALNILSENQEWYSLVPENTVLTPHPKEFERLVGHSSDSYSRLESQIQFSKKWKVIVVLKGAHTSVSFPNGHVYFNNTGNPGMATAGSGDVLTGIILGLLAQNYSPQEATLLGVYIHGMAGDLATKGKGQESLIAGDIIDLMGKAFYKLHK